MNDTTEKRLLSKVVFPEHSDCWEFIGSRYPNGYGQLWNGKRPEQAHRVSYRHYVGEIPEGMEIDHKCRNRCCVNPKHLRIVTHRVNMRVSNTVMGLNARKSKCKRGHPLSGTNLHITPTGSRQCRECLRLHARNARLRKKNAKLGVL